MLPSSIAAFFGCMSISASQPDTTPVATGRTAQNMGSCWAASSATCLAIAAAEAKGP